MATELVLDNGARLPLSADTRIAFTRQDTDILKPGRVQATGSTSFRLEDTQAVHAALGAPQLGTSASGVPYGELACTVEQDGRELLPKARAFLDGYEPGKGYDGQVLAGNKNFYSLLEGRSLRELDLGEYDHFWTLNVVGGQGGGAGHTGWRQGYVYDFYDRGRGGPAPGATVHLHNDEVLPSVYVRRVWEQVFVDAGVRWRGTLPAMFDRLLLPTPAHPGYGEQFRKARLLIAGIGGGNEDDGAQSTGRDSYTRIVPFDVTPSALGYVAPTQALVWEPDTYGWRAQEACYVSVTAGLPVKLRVTQGTATARLRVHRNEQAVLDEKGAQKEGTPVEWKRGDEDARTVSVAESRLLVQAGDLLQIRVELRGESGAIRRWGFELYKTFVENDVFLPAEYFKVEVLPDFPPEGVIRLQDLLPDWSQTEFVKACVGLLGLSQQTDPYADEVTFRPAASCLARLSTAPALDGLLDAGQATRREWHLDGMARRNAFRWKEDKANPDTALELGDGWLPCEDGTLEAEQTLLTLPWAATAAGTNGLLLLPRYKRRTGGVVNPGEEVAYDTQTVAPRLTLQTTRTHSVTIVSDTRSLPATARVAVFVSLDELEDLDFARTLLPRYYPHLAAVLRRPLRLLPWVRLSEADFTAFDQLNLVWLESEGHYFWVNKIVQYEAGKATTQHELLRLTL